ncbi:MAG: hypothetical protein OXG56_09365 [Gammaproteobacteria bacterium]|nr:hypothetical protein [Gammaproteobacteria bacterium]
MKFPELFITATILALSVMQSAHSQSCQTGYYFDQYAQQCLLDVNASINKQWEESRRQLEQQTLMFQQQQQFERQIQIQEQMLMMQQNQLMDQNAIDPCDMLTMDKGSAWYGCGQ